MESLSNRPAMHQPKFSMVISKGICDAVTKEQNMANAFKQENCKVSSYSNVDALGTISLSTKMFFLMRVYFLFEKLEENLFKSKKYPLAMSRFISRKAS